MDEHGASTCCWACPTLYLATPIWLYAWDASWTCLRSPKPRVMGSTARCATCPNWEAPTEARPAPSGAIAGSGR
jgi:hypothetical protein